LGDDLPIQQMPANGGEKRSWPELVGWDKVEAKAHLEATTTKAIYLVPEGSVVTMDWNQDRVRVMFNPATNKVSSAPHIG
jgi:hypothetical protein